MASTLPADFNFVPKVWSDHITAYWRKLLLFGQVAALDDTLKSKPGTTINFPFYLNIGPAEMPSADESLTPDKLQDDSFSATVHEAAKALAIRKAAFYASADEQDNIVSEAQKQIARVLAELM